MGLLIAILAALADPGPRPLSTYAWQERAGGYVLSHDGTRLLSHRLAPGKIEIVVAPLDRPEEAAVLFEREWPEVASFGSGPAAWARADGAWLTSLWSPDDRFVLVAPWDEIAPGGLLSIDVQTGEVREILDLPPRRFYTRSSEPDLAPLALVRETVTHPMSGRTLAEARLYEVDPSGQQPAVLRWRSVWGLDGLALDEDEDPRLVWNPYGRTSFAGTPDERWMKSGNSLLAVEGRGARWLETVEDEAQGAGWYPIAGWVYRDEILERDDRFHDKAGIWAFDVRTGRHVSVWEDARWDVSGALVGRDNALRAVALARARREWIVLDPTLAADFAFLRNRLDGNFSRIAAEGEGDLEAWLVHATSGTDPGSDWLYRRAAKTLVRLGPDRGEFDAIAWRPMEAAEFPSRDGLTLTAYATRPDPARFGPGPWPLVVVVHDGPWGEDARDRLEFRKDHQILADHGYAVLSVNYRGTGGFGRTFARAAEGEWGGKMQDDLLDGVKWAVDRGIALRQRVAISGIGYGGYAALAGLTMTPDAFRCGIAGGATGTLLRKKMGGELVYEELGTRSDRIARSPVTHVGAMRAPLLLWHGAKDGRIPKAQIDGFVEKATELGKPLTFLVYPEAGHRLTAPEDAAMQQGVELAFLSGCLGGISEPFADLVAASSVTTPVGADRIPGLEAALAER